MRKSKYILVKSSGRKIKVKGKSDKIREHEAQLMREESMDMIG